MQKESGRSRGAVEAKRSVPFRRMDLLKQSFGD